MKPDGQEEESESLDDPIPIAGDVIGDTAYSERFVLKILLHFANLDTLKDEIQEKSFEDNLCTLWDMTAERDVVLFLQKHDVLNLLNFALPTIESPRIIEIIVGIIGNMCCQKEVVQCLLKMDSLIAVLLDYMKSDDSLILIQVLRFVSSCLFVAEEEQTEIWMNKFENSGYAATLYFILKNSSHKELLLTALENFNTLTCYCNNEKTRVDFFNQFVMADAIESLGSAFTEVTSQKEACDTEEYERILVITLQITLHLVGFDQSPDIYSDSKDDIVKIIKEILNYYENKFINLKELDIDLVDIVDSTNAIVKTLDLSKTCGLDNFFLQSLHIWKGVVVMDKSTQSGCGFEDEDQDQDEIKSFSTQLKPPLSLLLFNYMAKCSEENMLKCLDVIGSHFEDISNCVQDKVLQTLVSKRAANYRTRLKEIGDS